MRYLGKELLAKPSSVGVVKVGTNLTVDSDGTLHGNNEPDCITIKQELFTVGAGQTVFTLTNGSYNTDSNSLFLYVYGLKQSSDVLIELSPTSFEILGDLPEGVEIMVEYIETVNVLIGVKGDTGEKGEKGDTGTQGLKGDDLEYNWSGTSLGVRVKGTSTYVYTDLKGASVADSIEWANILGKPTLFDAQVFHAGITAPANKNLIWIDTN